MKQISIFKDSVLTNRAQFETDQELNAWFEKHENKGTWRTKEKQIVSVDIDGNEVIETLPITHTFEIKDISSEINDQKDKDQKRENARVALKSLNPSSLTSTASLRDAVTKIIEALDLR